MDCSPPDSSVHGIPQARVPEAIPLSRGSSQLQDETGLLHYRLILYHPSQQGKPSQHRAFVLLILFMMPIVSLFTQFTEPRVGKAQKLRGWKKTRGAQELLLLLLSRLSLSDSVRPHRRQPTSLPRPWDSPGKNTGVGCHFLLQCMRVKSESEVAQSCPTRHDPMGCSLLGSSVHGMFQARGLEWES